MIGDVDDKCYDWIKSGVGIVGLAGFVCSKWDVLHKRSLRAVAEYSNDE